MNTQEYIALEEKFGAHNYAPLDVVPQSMDAHRSCHMPFRGSPAPR